MSLTDDLTYAMLPRSKSAMVTFSTAKNLVEDVGVERALTGCLPLALELRPVFIAPLAMMGPEASVSALELSRRSEVPVLLSPPTKLLLPLPVLPTLEPALEKPPLEEPALGEPLSPSRSRWFLGTKTSAEAVRLLLMDPDGLVTKGSSG